MFSCLTFLHLHFSHQVLESSCALKISLKLSFKRQHEKVRFNSAPTKIPAYRELPSCVNLLQMEEFDRCVSQLLRHHACQFVCFRIRVCKGKYIHFIPTNPLLKNHVSMDVSSKETRQSFDHDCTDNFWPCLVSIETVSVWATAKLLCVGSG